MISHIKFLFIITQQFFALFNPPILLTLPRQKKIIRAYIIPIILSSSLIFNFLVLFSKCAFFFSPLFLLFLLILHCRFPIFAHFGYTNFRRDSRDGSPDNEPAPGSRRQRYGSFFFYFLYFILS